MGGGSARHIINTADLHFEYKLYIGICIILRVNDRLIQPDI
jgi:hypothetical protein